MLVFETETESEREQEREGEKKVLVCLAVLESDGAKAISGFKNIS